MNLIVVSDIFGKTESINQLIAKLSPFYSEVTVIDPYEGQNISFENEEHAYQYFQQNCGITKLTAHLENEVINSKEKIDIIGFSVGGSSAWEISGKDISTNIRNVVSFYGSRIREKTNISPQYPTSVIFPAVEKSFELGPVIQAVENKQNVEVIRINYLHGFMNRESKNFSETGYKYFSDWLAKKAA
ncbi:Dienelactone hydrolase [Desulfuromusa kysingii]|uniref:Dienelactone hydrolase n=1 Tax=Desulfuromusa kysingii TaxID=37625 RepID=A0A1H3YMS1_9BACT|nr:dienelactone hydrolase family protein [Desulfuromusa kysingii]SEA12338.1 Dienelactone hydrolase [Desulfuromusa kysingii]